MRWLTGFTGTSAAAVIGRDGTRRFVTDFRYLTQSAEELDPAWERELAVDLLAGVVKRGLTAPLRLGFDDAHLSVCDHAKLAGLVPDGVELLAAGGLVEQLRARKDPDELDRVRAAAALADDALVEVLARGLAGRTERDVALDLEVAMRRLGAEAASFPPIVAAGEHGARPHASPRDVEIPAGTLCVVDWGAQLDGYASDCTRTFATGELDAARPRALRARAPRPGGRARGRAPRPDRPRGRRGGARGHRRGRSRRALRPRPRPRRRARGPRGSAAVQAGRGRRWPRAWS